MEKELEKLIKNLDKNLEKYCQNIVKFTLYRETGVWEGEKPTGKWLKTRIDDHFETPVLAFIAENSLYPSPYSTPANN